MKIVLLYGLIVLLSSSTVFGAFGFGGHDKYNDRMLLSEVSALTLYHGKMTNARRSSPVPQLKCVGGTAGCQAFVPQVVQCYNRGGDGYDVQWECKTDMDNAYRFGKVEVVCEGFDHPDDPYILRGSCGLEYTLDLTMEGHMHKNQKNHDYYGSQHSSHHNNYHQRHHQGYNQHNPGHYHSQHNQGRYYNRNNPRHYYNGHYHDHSYHGQPYHGQPYHGRGYHDNDHSYHGQHYHGHGYHDHDYSFDHNDYFRREHNPNWYYEEFEED